MGASQSKKTVINAPEPEQKKTNMSFERFLQYQLKQDRREAAAKREQARRAADRMSLQREAAADYEQASPFRRAADRMGPQNVSNYFVADYARRAADRQMEQDRREAAADYARRAADRQMEQDRREAAADYARRAAVRITP